MAQSLVLKIIAEGLETAEQVSWLLKRAFSIVRTALLRRRYHQIYKFISGYRTNARALTITRADSYSGDGNRWKCDRTLAK